jgi:16S rRNA processing protein RimM
MTGSDHKLLGTVVKTHGVRGELIIRTTEPSFELNEDWELIFLQIDGIMVPFFISSLRPFKAGEWVLKLDWYEDRTKAESLVGYSAWIPHRVEDPISDVIYLDELIGFEFRDENTGKKGRILHFMDIPDNPVFEADLEGEKIMVPASEDFILEINAPARQIVFKFPNGLI